MVAVIPSLAIIAILLSFFPLPAGADAQGTKYSDDCQLLLGIKDTLAGSGGAGLNWDTGLHLRQWTGVWLDSQGSVVTLNWMAATFNDVQSQQVRRRIPWNVQWTDFTVGVNDTSWTDTSVVSGTSYIYRIRAKGAKTGENGRMSNRQVVSIP